jgi:5-methylcytosine-specific restriction endonuclease McrA
VEAYFYTLKLDAAWQPLEIIDSLKAFGMVYSGRAKIVENYNQQFNALFYYPSIIVLNSYIRKGPVHLSPTRMNIYWRDFYRCQYCREKFHQSKLTLDHVVPKSRGGKKSWENLVTCCQRCNQKKGDKTPLEASMELFNVPSVPKFSVMRTRPHVKVPLSWKKFI